MSSLFPNQLRVVCTGRDGARHASRELAHFTLVTRADGQQLRPAVDYRGYTPKARRGLAPRDESGKLVPQERITHLAEVIVHQRSDGGQTFEVPTCPCSPRSSRRLLRDDKLMMVLELRKQGVGDGVLDIAKLA